MYSALVLLLTAFSLCANAQDKAADYRLGEGDGIKISVFQNPDLSLETRVSENGMITYPLVGAIKIGGMTIPAAEQAIAAALKAGGYIAQPQVNILLTKNLGNQVSVLGQVGRAGRYPLDNFTIKLSEMVAIAGGIGQTGADVAIITGTRDGKPFRREVDIVGMFLDDKLNEDLVVAGGDVIYVHRQPMFFIYGEAQRSGSYRIERRMTIRQALALGGGPTLRGTVRNLSVYRRGTSGAVATVSVDLDDPVQPDDVIFVRERLF
jgi:polysaccharide export outer membrane protein